MQCDATMGMRNFNAQACSGRLRKKLPMPIVFLGIDLAKEVFALPGLDRTGKALPAPAPPAIGNQAQQCRW